MRIYAKKLLSQESGYSGDTPDQRGKYILVSQKNYCFFTFLSTTTLNDSRVINIILESEKNIGVNIVYHNARYFPESHDRAHNEIRIYRNSALDYGLGLDRGVIIVLMETNNKGFYRAFSVQPGDNLFNNWDGLAAHINLNGPVDESDVNFKDNRLNSTYVSINESMSNEKVIVEDVVKRLNTQRKQQPGLMNDPGKILEFVINSQQAYADWVRQIYQSKCAVRKVPLVLSDAVGLDACHIMGHAEGGPLLPTNGILLSKDIHACFDKGLISLNSNNEIIVSPTVHPCSKIWEFKGVKIEPIEEYKLFSPYSLYVDHHRNNRFILV